ncbi:hypothetical protein JDV02_002517 [Purpureocillium takamizusanense]|uniref:DUF7896 domain-containing protein n=1 Tax=Purpureocillium takamizusanense TaxID=2060973 RepID=A0A9Q8V8W7_9HYPO|nr:uncharacterized protein JDV02_002517 [Purpureocillium takamizusanense]UNI16041.1 hypothetical protein JDV02_002517 [Purpureocillium takamizusanense]
MNQLSSNGIPVEEFQRALAQCEAEAAFYRQLLGNVDSAQPTTSLDHFTASGPSSKNRNATGLAAAAIPRSRSNMGPSAMDAAVTQQPRSGSKWSGTAHRRRAYSQQHHPAQAMSRSASSRSDQSISLQPQVAASSSLGISHSFPRSSPISRPLPSVQEHGGLTPDVGMDPSVYLSSSGWVDHDMSYVASTGTNLSPHDIYDGFTDASACPSMISAPSVSEPSQPLTRQNSTFDSTARDGTMMRLVSSQSHLTEERCTQDSFTSFAASKTPDPRAKATARDQDFFGVGTGFPPQAQTYPATTPLTKTTLFPAADTTSMERSVSNTSMASTRSTGSNLERRSKEALQRVRQNSNRNIIAPKPQQSSSNGRTSASSAPPKKDGKVALQKTPYQRPKHPKVYCEQCNEHPDGFRGDHELRRHLNAKHKGVVKKFVCRDPATVGLQSSVQVLYPLADCKACNSKKQYGAYYNAAAHLRRTHFKPKAPRGKNKNASDEKRGGKGGGDWPGMMDLKMWYTEVYVSSDGSVIPDDGADEVEDDALDAEDASMSGYSGLDEGGEPPFSANSVYGMTLSSAVDGQYQDGAGAMSAGATAGMPSATPVGFLSYNSLYTVDSATSDYATTHSPFGSGVSPTMAVTPAYYDSSAPGMADYMWPMDDV